MGANVVSGLLVVDKPRGPTSHDVVAQVRRVLGQRSVGHAGTLDPMASGVLVLAIGEATKLVAYATSQEKSYRARVEFGCGTETLDAEGEVVERGPIPPDVAGELRALGGPGQGSNVPAPSAERRTEGPIARALAAERARTEQVPPAYSAIKQGGLPAYRRARKGEEVVLLPRPVAIRELEVEGSGEASLVLRMTVSKGYYVRSLARDLGQALGVPAHLAELRRTRSGPFELSGALVLPAVRSSLLEALLPLERAARLLLPVASLTDEGMLRARRGQPLSDAHFVAAPEASPSAWLCPRGSLVAIGTSVPERGEHCVARGFVQPTSSDPS